MAPERVTEQWDAMQARVDELTSVLANPVLDQRQRQELQKEYAHLSGILAHYQELQALESQLEHARKQQAENKDFELAVLHQEEVGTLEQLCENKKTVLEQLLYPPDPLDKHDVYIEIRAGAGGQEAALFAADLAGMYTNYALSRGWAVSVIDVHETDLKGYKEITLSIEGKGAYGALKFESGTHRVQRVPATEASGRVHTSTATVAIFPEVGQAEEMAGPAVSM
jgi:peptide chain release factor 1